MNDFKAMAEATRNRPDYSEEVKAARARAARPSHKHAGKEVPFAIKLTGAGPHVASTKLPRSYRNIRVQFWEPDPATTQGTYAEVSADGSAENIGANGFPCAPLDPSQYQDSAKSLLIKNSDYIYYNVSKAAAGDVWIICYLSGGSDAETEAGGGRTIIL